jgi:hypothetical protein
MQYIINYDTPMFVRLLLNTLRSSKESITQNAHYFNNIDFSDKITNILFQRSKEIEYKTVS